MAAAPYTVVHGGNGRGRVTVATRLLTPGEVVLTEHAVACVASAGRPLCDDCLTSITESNRVTGTGNHHHHCAGCRSLFGSSGGLEAPRGSSPPSCAVRLAAKILFRRCSGLLGDQQVSGIDRLMFQQDEQQRLQFQLESSHDKHRHRSSRHKEDEENSAQVARLVARMDYVVTYVEADADASLPPAPQSNYRGETTTVLNDALLDLARKELGRVSLNAINTCDGSGATGLGLFPEAAMFNHGCRPNCQAWWRGSKLEIRCTKPVPAGEELCFSYIPVDQPSAVRRAQLRDNWFFTCLCERCVTGQWDAELAGLRCPVVSCSGAVPPPWRSGGSSASCNKCGRDSQRPIVPRSASQEAGQGLPQASAAAATAPGDRDVAKLAHLHHPPDTGHHGRGGATMGPVGTMADELTRAKRESCCQEESLARAGALFDRGMKAYMREDAEVALVALGESLRVRERLLHPFNKELLRTLRYASYAAIATQRWVSAYSFLSRWLHPMETMFGAAEVWDVAAMRIDAGLVLDKLHATTAVPRRLGGSLQSRAASAQPDTADSRASNAACGELAEGLKWIWICLGRDSGLPAEAAALEVCVEQGVTL
eukprot:g12103.t1